MQPSYRARTRGGLGKYISQGRRNNMDGQGREGHWDKGSNMERGEEQRSDYEEEQLK